MKMLARFLVIVSIMSAFESASAQAPGETGLFHVGQNTYGCASPDATRALSDPRETRGPNTAWFKGVFANGRCVTITPRSPWQYISRDQDVALMSYAGTVGAPGTYYIRAELLADAAGRHPGEAELSPAPTATAPATESAPVVSSAPVLGQPQTALAPQPQVTPPPATLPADLPAQPATIPASRETGWAWVGWLLLLLAIVGAAILLAWRSSPGLISRRSAAGPAYPVPLPDHVVAEARRLASTNGISLEEYLSTLLIERIGEIRAAEYQAWTAKKAGSSP